MRVLANAGKNIEELTAVWTGVLHTIGRHEWQPKFRSEIDQLFIDAIFVAQEMALDLDENIVATEDLDKQLHPICSTLGSARALACNIRRLAECIMNVREIVQDGRVSGEGAGNSTRGACAPQSEEYDQ